MEMRVSLCTKTTVTQVLPARATLWGKSWWLDMLCRGWGRRPTSKACPAAGLAGSGVRQVRARAGSDRILGGKDPIAEDDAGSDSVLCCDAE
eukprot:1896733-Rhodomonas_salina.2